MTFDDPGILSAARNNPYEFLSGYEGNLIVDEVQRVPEIFLAIKEAVDRKRKAGKYILTGSSNVLLLPKVSDSLAGRMEMLNLYPLTQNEIAGSDYNFIDEAFAKEFKMPAARRKNNDISARILSGGFPEMLTRKNPVRLDAWFKSYVTTILQRDLRDIANVEKLSELPRLLNLLAARAGTLLNFAEISRSASIPQTTLKRYVSLLEAVFLIYLLPAWLGNLSKRLIKTPKLYLSYTGLLSHLIGFEKEKIVADPLSWGRIVENFVLMELLKQSLWSEFNLSLFYFRTASGHEIDLVIEHSSGSLVGVEIKASSKVTADNFNHLKMFAEETGKKFLRGFVFYTGNEPIPFTKNLFAMPLNILW